MSIFQYVLLIESFWASSMYTLNFAEDVGVGVHGGGGGCGGDQGDDGGDVYWRRVDVYLSLWASPTTASVISLSMLAADPLHGILSLLNAPAVSARDF